MTVSISRANQQEDVLGWPKSLCEFFRNILQTFWPIQYKGKETMWLHSWDQSSCGQKKNVTSFEF